jgi:hypothetical protein
MKSIFALVLFALFVVPATALAQCPAGLTSIGRLYADSGGGREVKQHGVTVVFPEYFKLDKTYQQASVVAAGGGASSDMTAAKVPPGLHIIPGGDKEWAVSEPEFSSAEVDDDDRVKKYKYSMYLYCATGDSVADRTRGGCNVHVDVCAKKR